MEKKSKKVRQISLSPEVAEWFIRYKDTTRPNDKTPLGPFLVSLLLERLNSELSESNPLGLPAPPQWRGRETPDTEEILTICQEHLGNLMGFRGIENKHSLVNAGPKFNQFRDMFRLSVEGETHEAVARSLGKSSLYARNYIIQNLATFRKYSWHSVFQVDHKTEYIRDLCEMHFNGSGEISEISEKLSSSEIAVETALGVFRDIFTLHDAHCDASEISDITKRNQEYVEVFIERHKDTFKAFRSFFVKDYDPKFIWEICSRRFRNRPATFKQIGNQLSKKSPTVTEIEVRSAFGVFLEIFKLKGKNLTDRKIAKGTGRKPSDVRGFVEKHNKTWTDFKEIIESAE